MTVDDCKRSPFWSTEWEKLHNSTMQNARWCVLHFFSLERFRAIDQKDFKLLGDKANSIKKELDSEKKLISTFKK